MKQMRNKNVDITMNDIHELLYFIISIYEDNEVHIQGTSLKSDLLGGFIDRWINKVAEELTFNKILLKEKDYKVISDFFVYNSNVAKNASDVLGLEKDNKIIKFTEFVENRWEHIENTPFIEVKAFRKSQQLSSVRIPQWDKNRYYVFVETDFKNNYLKSFFRKDFFDSAIHKNLLMSETFIAEKDNPNIKMVKEISPFAGILGSLNLIGVFTGNQLKEYSTLFKAKESPIYISNIEKIENFFNIRSLLKNPLSFKELKFWGNFISYENEFLRYEKAVNLKIINLKKIKIFKENKGSIYIYCEEDCTINNYSLKKNFYYKITVSIFQRSSGWDELIGYKENFRQAKDSTLTLLKQFDKLIVKNN